MTMRSIAYAAPTSFVSKTEKELKANGYIVTRDRDTSVAKTPEGEVIFRALKMRTTWVVRGDDRVFTKV